MSEEEQNYELRQLNAVTTQKLADSSLGGNGGMTSFMQGSFTAPEDVYDVTPVFNKRYGSLGDCDSSDVHHEVELVAPNSSSIENANGNRRSLHIKGSDEGIKIVLGEGISFQKDSEEDEGADESDELLPSAQGMMRSLQNMSEEQRELIDNKISQIKSTAAIVNSSSLSSIRAIQMKGKMTVNQDKSKSMQEIKGINNRRDEKVDGDVIQKQQDSKASLSKRSDNNVAPAIQYIRIYDQNQDKNATRMYASVEYQSLNQSKHDGLCAKDAQIYQSLQTPINQSYIMSAQTQNEQESPNQDEHLIQNNFISNQSSLRKIQQMEASGKSKSQQSLISSEGNIHAKSTSKREKQIQNSQESQEYLNYYAEKDFGRAFIVSPTKHQDGFLQRNLVPFNITPSNKNQRHQHQLYNRASSSFSHTRPGQVSFKLQPKILTTKIATKLVAAAVVTTDQNGLELDKTVEEEKIKTRLSFKPGKVIQTVAQKSSYSGFSRVGILGLYHDKRKASTSSTLSKTNNTKIKILSGKKVDLIPKRLISKKEKQLEKFKKHQKSTDEITVQESDDGIACQADFDMDFNNDSNPIHSIGADHRSSPAFREDEDMPLFGQIDLGYQVASQIQQPQMCNDYNASNLELLQQQQLQLQQQDSALKPGTEAICIQKRSVVNLLSQKSAYKSSKQNNSNRNRSKNGSINHESSPDLDPEHDVELQVDEQSLIHNDSDTVVAPVMYHKAIKYSSTEEKMGESHPDIVVKSMADLVEQQAKQPSTDYNKKDVLQQQTFLTGANITDEDDTEDHVQQRTKSNCVVSNNITAQHQKSRMGNMMQNQLYLSKEEVNEKHQIKKKRRFTGKERRIRKELKRQIQSQIRPNTISRPNTVNSTTAFCKRYDPKSSMQIKAYELRNNNKNLRNSIHNDLVVTEPTINKPQSAEEQLLMAQQYKNMNSGDCNYEKIQQQMLIQNGYLADSNKIENIRRMSLRKNKRLLMGQRRQFHNKNNTFQTLYLNYNTNSKRHSTTINPSLNELNITQDTFNMKEQGGLNNFATNSGIVSNKQRLVKSSFENMGTIQVNADDEEAQVIQLSESDTTIINHEFHNNQQVAQKNSGANIFEAVESSTQEITGKKKITGQLLTTEDKALRQALEQVGSDVFKSSKQIRRRDHRMNTLSISYQKISTEVNDACIVSTSQQTQEQQSKENEEPQTSANYEVRKLSNEFLLNEIYSERQDDSVEESDGENALFPQTKIDPIVKTVDTKRRISTDTQNRNHKIDGQSSANSTSESGRRSVFQKQSLNNKDGGKKKQLSVFGPSDNKITIGFKTKSIDIEGKNMKFALHQEAKESNEVNQQVLIKPSMIARLNSQENNNSGLIKGINTEDDSYLTIKLKKMKTDQKLLGTNSSFVSSKKAGDYYQDRNLNDTLKQSTLHLSRDNSIGRTSINSRKSIQESRPDNNDLVGVISEKKTRRKSKFVSVQPAKKVLIVQDKQQENLIDEESGCQSPPGIHNIGISVRRRIKKNVNISNASENFARSKKQNNAVPPSWANKYHHLKKRNQTTSLIKAMAGFTKYTSNDSQPQQHHQHLNHQFADPVATNLRKVVQSSTIAGGITNGLENNTRNSKTPQPMAGIRTNTSFTHKRSSIKDQQLLLSGLPSKIIERKLKANLKIQGMVQHASSPQKSFENYRRGYGKSTVENYQSSDYDLTDKANFTQVMLRNKSSKKQRRRLNRYYQGEVKQIKNYEKSNITMAGDKQIMSEDRLINLFSITRDNSKDNTNETNELYAMVSDEKNKTNKSQQLLVTQSLNQPTSKIQYYQNEGEKSAALLTGKLDVQTNRRVQSGNEYSHQHMHHQDRGQSNHNSSDGAENNDRNYRSQKQFIFNRGESSSNKLLIRGNKSIRQAFVGRYHARSKDVLLTNSKSRLVPGSSQHHHLHQPFSHDEIDLHCHPEDSALKISELLQNVNNQKVGVHQEAYQTIPTLTNKKDKYQQQHRKYSQVKMAQEQQVKMNKIRRDTMEYNTTTAYTNQDSLRKIQRQIVKEQITNPKNTAADPSPPLNIVLQRASDEGGTVIAKARSNALKKRGQNLNADDLTFINKEDVDGDEKINTVDTGKPEIAIESQGNVSSQYLLEIQDPSSGHRHKNGGNRALKVVVYSNEKLSEMNSPIDEQQSELPSAMLPVTHHKNAWKHQFASSPQIKETQVQSQSRINLIEAEPIKTTTTGRQIVKIKKNFNR